MAAETVKAALSIPDDMMATVSEPLAASLAAYIEKQDETKASLKLQLSELEAEKASFGNVLDTVCLKLCYPDIHFDSENELARYERQVSESQKAKQKALDEAVSLRASLESLGISQSICRSPPLFQFQKSAWANVTLAFKSSSRRFLPPNWSFSAPRCLIASEVAGTVASSRDRRRAASFNRQALNSRSRTTSSTSSWTSFKV